MNSVAIYGIFWKWIKLGRIEILAFYFPMVADIGCGYNVKPETLASHGVISLYLFKPAGQQSTNNRIETLIKAVRLG